MKDWLRALGIVLAVVVVPTTVIFGACVSFRDVCEAAGGEYGHVADAHLCGFPADHPSCPPPYSWRRREGGCAIVSAIPGTWRWNAWGGSGTGR